MSWEETECSKLCLFVYECMFLAGEGTHCPLWLYSLWHCLFKVSIACHSGPQPLTTQPVHLRQGPLLPLAMAPFSPPLHNYPGNCGVIECITCSKETLPLFNKQLEYAPHVVGEQEEEHIRADFFFFFCLFRKSWVVQSEMEALRVCTHANFPNTGTQI